MSLRSLGKTLIGASAAGLLAFACSGTGGNVLLEPPAADGGSDGSSIRPPTKDSAAPGNDSGVGDADAASAHDGPSNACPYMDSTDHDGDGFSFTDGDCNDCDPNVNPGAYDIPGDGIDQDCDGTPDDEPTGCDATVTLDSTDPLEAAKAIDLCRQTTETAQGKQRTWGVISAAFVAPDGSDNCVDTTTLATSSCNAGANWAVGHGNLSMFGMNSVRQGTHMLGLSSGTARQPTDPGYQDVSGFDKGYTTAAPSPFPTSIPACPGNVTGDLHDGIALKLTIRVPTNMSSFSFTENFFAYDFPEYVCTTYNDWFVALVTPQVAGLSNPNITFDSQGNPVDVDSTFLGVCDPQTTGGLTFTCPRGTASLAGTGFGIDTELTENHAATGWLIATAPVNDLRGKDVAITFAIWDSTDGVLDSTVLIDDFTWSTAQVATASTVTSP